MTEVKWNRPVFLYEFYGFHISVAEDLGPLGCDALSLGDWSPAPQRNSALIMMGEAGTKWQLCSPLLVGYCTI
jgi:hypothetical protein